PHPPARHVPAQHGARPRRSRSVGDHRDGEVLVMDEPAIERMLAAADDLRRRRNWNAAIETLRRILTIDPGHARAHAALALALVGARRVTAAEIEAGLALAEDGNRAFCHLAMAVVR